MATVIVGVMRKLPEPVFWPVFTAALKNFTGVGAGVAAGTVNGYETLLLGFVEQPLLHATVGAVWIVEAVVDKVCAPAVNVVDVIVSFQPAPLPPDGVFATVRPSA